MREEVLEAAAKAHYNKVQRPNKPDELWEGQPVEVKKMFREVVREAVSAALRKQQEVA